MRKLLIVKKAILLIILLILSVTCINAQTIKDVTIIKTNNKLYINARLDIDKNILEDVFELLHNGVEVTIVYMINIYKEKPLYLLVDSNIKTINYKKIIKYKLWEKQYYLTDGGKSQKISDRKEINKKLKEINKVFLINENEFKKGKYYLKIKASLESVKLFPPLSWIFDLVYSRGFETPWTSKQLK